jgi:hypothetical protein
MQEAVVRYSVYQATNGGKGRDEADALQLHSALAYSGKQVSPYLEMVSDMATLNTRTLRYQNEAYFQPPS